MDLINLFQTILVGGVATTLATEILKSPLITFVKAERYPRITAVVVSIIAAVVTVLSQHLALASLSIVNWITVVAGTVLIAVATYNNLLKR